MKSVRSRLLCLVRDPIAPRLGSWPVSGAWGAAPGSLCELLIALGTASQGCKFNDSLSISKFNFLPPSLTMCPYKSLPRSGLMREMDRGRQTGRRSLFCCPMSA